jgi:signal transduction histidine kinase
LNTALNLLERADLPEEKHDQIHQVIQTEFYRLKNLTTSFLDYARLESGKEKFVPTRFDLNQLIRDSVDVMQIHAGSKGSVITIDLPDQPLLLTADNDRIKQVILNLLNNAIMYSPAGGTVTITTNATSRDISFSVQDNGPGIPHEYLDLIFERYYRHPNVEGGNTGSGLGLTICKKIVDAHKGKIEVSSLMGEGTTFTVYLPLNQEI